MLEMVESTLQMGKMRSKEESPDTAGAGRTGGIIGGIIAAIIALAVAATAILICRQQREEDELHGRPEEEEEDDELQGPPAYKPPPPKMRLDEPDMPSQLFTLGSSEHVPLKAPFFQSGLSAPEQDTARYHELPTLEERAAAPPSFLEEPGDAAGEDEDYLDKVNPIYDALAYSPAEAYRGRGFVMSRAMYV